MTSDIFSMKTLVSFNKKNCSCTVPKLLIFESSNLIQDIPDLNVSFYILRKAVGPNNVTKYNLTDRGKV